MYGQVIRHRLASRLIESYAGKRPTADGLNIVRTLAPGAGIVQLIATLAVQAPGIYQPLARDLAVIYSVDATILAQPSIAADERSAQTGAALAAEFSPEFLRGLIQELAPELWMRAAAGAVPGIGRWLAAGSDTAFTATLSWRLGTMAVIYLLNGAAWVGSKMDTYALARDIAGRPSGQARGQVRLEDLPYRVPTVYWRLIDELIEVIRMRRRADPTSTDDAIRALLQSSGVPDDQIETALRECPRP